MQTRTTTSSSLVSTSPIVSGGGGPPSSSSSSSVVLLAPPPPPSQSSDVSLYVRTAERIFSEQLAFKDVTNNVKRLSNDLTAAYPFVRVRALRQLMDTLKGLTNASINPTTGHPIDNMMGVGIPNALRVSWEEAQRVLGSNLISPMFHKIFPRRDLVMALAGGAGVPLANLSREGALQWTTLTKPETLQKLEILTEGAAVTSIKLVSESANVLAATQNKIKEEERKRRFLEREKQRKARQEEKEKNRREMRPAATQKQDTGSDSDALASSSVSSSRSTSSSSSAAAAATSSIISKGNQNTSTLPTGPAPSSSATTTTKEKIAIGAAEVTARQQSIQKGILAARSALHDISLYEQEMALRIIQGLCVLVPQQKVNVADSPLIPFLIEACHCCLQHVQQLALVEREIRNNCGAMVRQSAYYLEYHEALRREREASLRRAQEERRRLLEKERSETETIAAAVLDQLVTADVEESRKRKMANHPKDLAGGSAEAETDRNGNESSGKASLKTIQAFRGLSTCSSENEEEDAKDNRQREEVGGVEGRNGDPLAASAFPPPMSSTETVGADHTKSHTKETQQKTTNVMMMTGGSMIPPPPSRVAVANPSAPGAFHGGGTVDHPEVLLMRPELIAVMCALIDAVEAACHYCSKGLGLLAQIGGVRAMLSLACCPYTPAVLRLSIFDTISLFMKETDPFRRAVKEGGGGGGGGVVTAGAGVLSSEQPLPAMTASNIPSSVTGGGEGAGAGGAIGGGSDSLTTQFYMDRATASKFDGAVRGWLSTNHLFSCANTLLVLRDVGGIELPLGALGGRASSSSSSSRASASMTRAEATRMAHRASRQREKLYTEFITEINQRLIATV